MTEHILYRREKKGDKESVQWGGRGKKNNIRVYKIQDPWSCQPDSNEGQVEAFLVNYEPPRSGCLQSCYFVMTWTENHGKSD